MGQKLTTAVHGVTCVQRVASPAAQKAVLNVLAYRAPDDTGICWPDMLTNMQNTGLAERTVQRAIDALHAARHLSSLPIEGVTTFRILHPCGQWITPPTEVMILRHSTMAKDDKGNEHGWKKGCNNPALRARVASRICRINPKAGGALESMTPVTTAGVKEPNPRHGDKTPPSPMPKTPVTMPDDKKGIEFEKKAAGRLPPAGDGDGAARQRGAAGHGQAVAPTIDAKRRGKGEGAPIGDILAGVKDPTLRAVMAAAYDAAPDPTPPETDRTM